MNDTLLSAKDVVKKYGDYTALNKANISVPKSSIYGLLGPNGAGKTTLMRIINQITAPDSGRVLFDGELLNKEHIKEIGYLSFNTWIRTTCIINICSWVIIKRSWI